MDEKRLLLRHTLATLAYRATRAIEGAPAHFADFAGAGRTPAQILAHMGDLLDWALAMATGKPAWRDSEPLAWEAETRRFFAALGRFDAFLASDEPLQAPVERLFQGPVSDALTHTGQLAMLRRLAGCPTRGENFYLARIETGDAGSSQSAPVKTF